MKRIKSKKTNKKRMLKRNWSTQETNQLIDCIQENECLWNPESKYVTDRQERLAALSRIANEIGCIRTDVLMKWNAIRSTYRVK